MKKLSLFITLITITILSCTQQKESPSQQATSLQTTSLQEALRNLATPPQSFTINPNTTNAITTASGIQIIVPAGSLVNNDGTIPTIPITVSIREVIKKSDMIFNHISTVAGNKLIESFGMFNIEAMSNDQPLSVKKEKSLQVKFPLSVNAPDAGIFYGINNNGIIEWEADSSNMDVRREFEKSLTAPNGAMESYDSITTNPPQNSSAEPGSYLFEFNKLNWINCDRFIDTTDAKRIIITANKDHKPEAYTVFKEINSVMFNLNDETGLIRTGPIPPRYTVTIFLIDKKDDQFYLGSRQIKTGTIDSIHIEMQKVSEQELIQELKKLD